MEESLQKISEALSQPDCVGIIASAATVIAAIATMRSARAARKAADASRESNELQKKQIELQNRQNLFEIKAKNYSILNKYIRNYNNIKNKLNFDDTNQLFIDSMVNSTLPLLLNAIGREIDTNRIIKPSLLNAPTFSSYVKSAIEEIEYTITEIPLLFSDVVSDTSVAFLENYRDFIIVLYDYGLILEAEKRGTTDKSLKAVTDFYSLEKITKNMLVNQENIKNNNILDKMKNEIKLQKGKTK